MGSGFGSGFSALPLDPTMQEKPDPDPTERLTTTLLSLNTFFYKVKLRNNPMGQIFFLNTLLFSSLFQQKMSTKNANKLGNLIATQFCRNSKLGFRVFRPDPDPTKIP